MCGCVICARRLCESPTSEDGVVGLLAFGVTCRCAAATTARSHRQSVADGKRTALVILAAFVRGVDPDEIRRWHFRAALQQTRSAQTPGEDRAVLVADKKRFEKPRAGARRAAVVYAQLK